MDVARRNSRACRHPKHLCAECGASKNVRRAVPGIFEHIQSQQKYLRAFESQGLINSMLKQLRAIFFLPVMVMVIVPALLVFGGGINWAWGLSALWFWVVAFLSGMGAVIGFWLFAQTVPLLVRCGQGTLAPWDPPGVWSCAGFIGMCAIR